MLSEVSDMRVSCYSASEHARTRFEYFFQGSWMAWDLARDVPDFESLFGRLGLQAKGFQTLRGFSMPQNIRVSRETASFPKPPKPGSRTTKHSGH